MNYLKLWDIITKSKINWRDLYHWFLKLIVGDKTKWVPFWSYRPIGKRNSLCMVFVRMNKNTGMLEWRTKKIIDKISSDQLPTIQLTDPSEQIKNIIGDGEWED